MSRRLLWQKLDFYARDSAAVHFHDREPKIAEVKTFTAFGDKSELIEHKATDRGVGGVLRQSDVVLCVQVANAERGVKDDRAIRKRERPLDDVELIVNFADKLLEDVFHRDQSKNAAELVHHNRH